MDKLKCISKIRKSKEISTQRFKEIVERFDTLNSKDEVRVYYYYIKYFYPTKNSFEL